MAAFASSPFPVDPSRVPDDAARYIRRTLLRRGIEALAGDPEDDDDYYLERVIVAGIIAVLLDDGSLDEVTALVSEYTRATGAVVAITSK